MYSTHFLRLVRASRNNTHRGNPGSFLLSSTPIPPPNRFLYIFGDFFGVTPHTELHYGTKDPERRGEAMWESTGSYVSLVLPVRGWRYAM
jgi:hypothetical protein